MHVAATNQRTNKVALVAGTRLVNFQASAATLLSADLLRTQTEIPGMLGRASAIYINKIFMGHPDLWHKSAWIHYAYPDS